MTQPQFPLSQGDDLLRPEDLADSSQVEIFVQDLPTPILRVLVRDHLVWMFIGAGIALIGFVLPADPWLWAAVRFLLCAFGLFFAVIRLFQLNAILAELRKRQASGKPRQIPAANPSPEETE